MKKLIIVVNFIFVSILLALILLSKPNIAKDSLSWEKISSGLEFTTLNFNKGFRNGKIYALKIDKPRKINILVNKNKKQTTLENLEKIYNPLVIINGSYFQEDYKPTGLLKIDNKFIYGLNKLGGSGILGITEQDVYIFHKNDLNNPKKYKSLMQNGPLIVENNGKKGIYSDDKVYSARTVIAITTDNKILIVVADINASPSLWELAELLTKGEENGGFSCKTALNLDGGASTGLRINLPNKKLVLKESDYIANAIGIF